MCGVEGDAGAAAAIGSEEPHRLASSLKRRSYEGTWETKYTEPRVQVTKKFLWEHKHVT